MFNKIFAIALNTFKETIRDRILYVILLFAILMSILSIILGSLSIGNNTKIILDLGLGSINIFGVILSIFVGTSLVFKEIDKRTIYVILSKPIERWQFILGKFLGLNLTLTIIIFLMSIVFITLIYLYKASVEEVYLSVISLILIMMEIYLINAVCILFSSFSTPLLSMAYVASVWVIGHFNPVMLTLAKYSTNSLVIKIVTVAHYIFPDLSKFNLKNNIDNLNFVLDYNYLMFTAVYWALYTAIILMVAVFFFNRKEFN